MIYNIIEINTKILNYKICIYIICIILHVKSMEFLYKTGLTFYKYKKYDIWDIIHSNFRLC
jgi:hypothetical protein